MLISSTFIVALPQIDGRSYVTETHVADDGQEYTYEYLADADSNPQIVLEERAKVIEHTLAQRAAAKHAVEGTSVPLTRFEFLSRFTPQERVAVRARAVTDPVVEDYMEMMKLSGNVSLTLARPGLQYLAAVGVLTSARAAAIGAE